MPAERSRLLGLLTRDVDRLERLVSGVRELARIDAQVAHEAMEIGRHRQRCSKDWPEASRIAACRSRSPSAAGRPPSLVRASADRLAQVFENILDNAAGFAPPGTVVGVSASVDGESCVVAVERSRAGDSSGARRTRVRALFQLPSRARAARREHMGLGLGDSPCNRRGLRRVRSTPPHRDGGGDSDRSAPAAGPRRSSLFSASLRSAQSAGSVS